MLRGEVVGRQFDQTDQNARNTSGYPRRRSIGCGKHGGGIDMDLMTTDTSVQYAPIEGGLECQRLPFYSRFRTNNTSGVDVFSHNVSHMPGSLQKCFGCCFPQPSLVGVVFAHISKCEAKAVIVVPNTRASWFPMINGARVRSVEIASQGAGSQFFRVHHQREAEPYTFGRGGMRAVEVEFRGDIHFIQGQPRTPHGYTTLTY